MLRTNVNTTLKYLLNPPAVIANYLAILPMNTDTTW